MKYKLLKLYWKLFGRPDCPPKKFSVDLKVNQYTTQTYYPRYRSMALEYQKGVSVEDIAEYYGVTRERVRQCLWKAYYDSEKK